MLPPRDLHFWSNLLRYPSGTSLLVKTVINVSPGDLPFGQKLSLMLRGTSLSCQNWIMLSWELPSLSKLAGTVSSGAPFLVKTVIYSLPGISLSGQKKLSNTVFPGPRFPVKTVKKVASLGLPFLGKPLKVAFLGPSFLVKPVKKYPSSDPLFLSNREK